MNIPPELAPTENVVQSWQVVTLLGSDDTKKVYVLHSTTAREDAIAWALRKSEARHAAPLPYWIRYQVITAACNSAEFVGEARTTINTRTPQGDTP